MCVRTSLKTNGVLELGHASQVAIAKNLVPRSFNQQNRQGFRAAVHTLAWRCTRCLRYNDEFQD